MLDKKTLNRKYWWLMFCICAEMFWIYFEEHARIIIDISRHGINYVYAIIWYKISVFLENSYMKRCIIERRSSNLLRKFCSEFVGTLHVEGTKGDDSCILYPCIIELLLCLFYQLATLIINSAAIKKRLFDPSFKEMEKSHLIHHNGKRKQKISTCRAWSSG